VLIGANHAANFQRRDKTKASLPPEEAAEPGEMTAISHSMGNYVKSCSVLLGTMGSQKDNLILKLQIHGPE